MAILTVESTKEERDAILRVLQFVTEEVSVATLAYYAGLTANRARWAIMDLERAELITRVVVKQVNKNYVRYKYAINPNKHEVTRHG